MNTEGRAGAAVGEPGTGVVIPESDSVSESSATALSSSLVGERRPLEGAGVVLRRFAGGDNESWSANLTVRLDRVRGGGGEPGGDVDIGSSAPSGTMTKGGLW